MRRLLTLVAGVGFASMLLGCHHTSGTCDCDKPGDYGSNYAPAGHAVLPGAIPAQPLPAAKDPGTTGMQKILEK
jgi:hypothetical protein